MQKLLTIACGIVGMLLGACADPDPPFTSRGGNECFWKDEDGIVHETGDPDCVDLDAGSDAQPDVR